MSSEFAVFDFQNKTKRDGFSDGIEQITYSIV